MAYRIEYDSIGGKYEIRRLNPIPLPVLTGISFLLFLLLVFSFWDAGSDLLREFLIPGENAVTVQAWQGMYADLRSGAPFHDALTTFCEDVIRGAQTGY